MATKKKQTATKKTNTAPEKTTVTRIKATDAGSSKKTAATAPVEAKKTAKKSVSTTKKTTTSTPKKPAAVTTDKQRPAIIRFFTGLAGYFKGAWEELKQVRWPTRRATWGLTGAVLIFSGFFVLLIVLLDAGFKLLFEQILG